MDQVARTVLGLLLLAAVACLVPEEDASWQRTSTTIIASHSTRSSVTR
jgi:hypothetical protein